MYLTNLITSGATLVRGELQEPFWFLRSALGLFSDYRNVGLFNDAQKQNTIKSLV